MISIPEYQQLKAKLEAMEKKISKLEGASEQILTRLREEHDCKSIEEAQKLLEQLEEEQGQAIERYELELREFKEKYGDMLDGNQ